MKIFDEHRSRSGRAEAKKREREIARLITRLLEMDDEAKFLEGLADLGITHKHSRYDAILKVWRDAR